MPKIIENIEARLMEEVKKQIEESGYGSVTIRSVAKACGVGVGTVYNYFSSKDELVATYMLKDWHGCVAAINAAAESADTPEPVLRCIWEQLCQFSERYSAIFKDEAAAAAFTGSFSRYHGMLRDQLASPIRRFCDSDFHAEFSAEALLVWTMAGKDFNEIYGMIGKLF